MPNDNFNPGRLVGSSQLMVDLVAEQQLHPSTCINCGASMMEYVFRFDVLDALLILAMASNISARLSAQPSDQKDFTIANQVRIPQLPCSLAIQCRTTQTSKLGLIAKVLNDQGRHVPGTWLITSRGWAAMRGEAVPARVAVWRGEIQERFDDRITISEALRLHTDKVEVAVARGKNPNADYRAEAAGYTPEVWAEFGRIHDGRLI